MNADNADKDQKDPLTERVLGAVFEVSNTLGAGFLEKVYERALLRELGLRGIRATAQTSIPGFYKGYRVGEYFPEFCGYSRRRCAGGRAEMCRSARQRASALGRNYPLAFV
jgi:hypothetical protein